MEKYKSKHIFFTIVLIISPHSYSNNLNNTGAIIKKIEANNAPKAIGPYSQAIKVTNASEILFISGQLPIVPETGLLVSDPAEATKQCLKNISAILQEADMDFKNIVDVTILLKNIGDFTVINEAYKLFLEEPYPARATFQAGALPKDAVVEIKMIAIK